MATRRKRSLRGLGASPSIHEKLSLAYYKEVTDGLVWRHALDSGSCKQAFAAMNRVHKKFGMGEAHDKALPSNKPTPRDVDAARLRALNAMKLYESEFAAQCLVGKGLSGLGRRPSRRRK